MPGHVSRVEHLTCSPPIDAADLGPEATDELERLCDAARKRPRVIAAFASETWSDQARLRVWAKLFEGQSELCVLLTEESTDANVVLARQLRCSGVAVALMRAGGTLRSPPELRAARARRDVLAMRMADEIVVFSAAEEADQWRNVGRQAVGRSRPISVLTP